MSEQKSLPVLLRDPRLNPHALAENPAWLWSADAARILWGNPAAAAIFSVDSPIALAGHSIDPKGSAALQIARLAGSLATGTAPRLERLRGFGGRFGGALLCACSRITLHDRTPAILIVATEAAGPALPLAERSRRLLLGCDEPVALFAADGALLHATPAAQQQLGQAPTLASLGIDPLAAVALASGRADGEHTTGRILLERIGSGASTALLASLATQPSAEGAPSEASAVEPDPAAQRPAEPPAPPSPVPGRQQPLRFVWQMNQEGRFSIDSEEFKTLLGPRTAAALDRPWSEIATELGLDPEQQVARAVASQQTWSGITIAFPTDAENARIAVELSGLPVFDRDRSFRGYRGFGVCRDGMRATEARRAPEEAVQPPVFRQTSADSSQNILPFRASASEKAPALTPVERNAFSELASRLTARLRAGEQQAKHNATPESTVFPPPVAPQPTAMPTIDAAPPAAPGPLADQRPILDRLPVGVLVYRLDRLIYANRAFLEWTGYDRLGALEEAGGLDALFVEPAEDQPGANNGSKALTIATSRGGQLPVEARLFTSPWEGESALVLMLTGVGAVTRPTVAAEPAPAPESREMRAILDATADGVLVLDQARTVLVANRSAEMLFGYEHGEMAGLPFTGLLAPEAQRMALEDLDQARPDGEPGEGREIGGRRRGGGLFQLLMAARPIATGSDRLCVTLRDITHWKTTETEMINARRQAEMASAAKSDFIAKISHEIRTPLNAIMGFTDVMAQERFGPIGNERYRQYLKDIQSSGGHLLSLLNDLLDLSKIEAGKLELKFARLDLNELTQECVGVMQAQASRERIIIRTSLASPLPPVTADARSVRQIALNLLSNSIKFTGAGGQVIVSTAAADDGGAVLRVRDTGVGMSEQDLAVALEPFRQLATAARFGSGGTGLGLPLTKALAEANRASFSIRSAIRSGTLVEVAFPGARLAAE